MDHAAQNGGTILEDIMKSQGIEMPTWDIADQNSIKVWEYASGKYAGQVSGEFMHLLELPSAKIAFGVALSYRN